jgi:molecular chaperone GrpE (heat shock protein)
MLKRFAILGLVLLFAGSATLWWVLAEKREEQQQTAQYQSKYGSELHKEMQQYDEWLRLPAEKRTALPPVLDEHGGIKTKAQLLQQQQGRLKADLDKLAGGEPDARALADFLYGENWQQELSKYKGRQEQKELILNSSIVCMSIGGAIFAGCLLLCTIRVVIKVSSGLGRLLADTLAARCAGRGADRRQSRHFQKTATPESFPSSRIEAQPDEVQATPQLQACSTEQAQSNKPLRSLSNVNKQRSENRVERQPKYAATAGHTLNAAKMELYRYAETCVPYESEEPSQAGEKKPPLSLEAPDPLNNTLVELTQHVAAIREYASTQQDRVKKLQEGYDWNIIRNFCLRVIRCIDNVENRIRERAGQNGEAAHLSEIRDELLFALESSGIEQFEPEINHDYRGLGKQAEAVKERESCDDPDLAGKIAKIVRPGYHYFMDDKHVRVVRPAMVMLFG